MKFSYGKLHVKMGDFDIGFCYSYIQFTGYNLVTFLGVFQKITEIY